MSLVISMEITAQVEAEWKVCQALSDTLGSSAIATAADWTVALLIAKPGS